MDLNNPNIPILGQTKTQPEQPNAPGLTANCEIHDSEIMEIERVVHILNDKIMGGKRVDYDAFDREIKDRFNRLGFVVNVAWWHTNIDGVKQPEITITDRIERGEFDHDRKVHEVTNDILELGDKGVIKPSDSDFTKPDHHH